jgi:hypothetical protein
MKSNGSGHQTYNTPHRVRIGYNSWEDEKTSSHPDLESACRAKMLNLCVDPPPTQNSHRKQSENVGGRTSRDANYVVPRPKHLHTYASSVRTLRMFGRILQHSLKYNTYKQHHRKLLMDGGNGCVDPLTKSSNPRLMDSCCIFVEIFGKNAVEGSSNITPCR